MPVEDNLVDVDADALTSNLLRNLVAHLLEPLPGCLQIRN
jgi:hypothetical protein